MLPLVEMRTIKLLIVRFCELFHKDGNVNKIASKICKVKWTSEVI